MTVIAIHQPGYIPWLAFFKKIINSDIFIFLDDVQYAKNYFHNRNKIRTNDGASWVTVPVEYKFGQLFNEIKIDNKKNWSKKHQKTISMSYSKAKYFDSTWKLFEAIYQDEFDQLLDLNMRIINQLMDLLSIKKKIIFSSELNIKKTGSDRILEICKVLNADTYISGSGNKEKGYYLNSEDFSKNNIDLIFQEYEHPIYNQCYHPFIPNLSILDLLFNHGNESKEILLNAETKIIN